MSATTTTTMARDPAHDYADFLAAASAARRCVLALGDALEAWAVRGAGPRKGFDLACAAAGAFAVAANRLAPWAIDVPVYGVGWVVNASAEQALAAMRDLRGPPLNSIEHDAGGVRRIVPVYGRVGGIAGALTAAIAHARRTGRAPTVAGRDPTWRSPT